MYIMFPVVVMVLLVTIGYFVMWTAVQPNIPKGVSGFGKVMAIILFIVAGVCLVSGMVYGPRMHRFMMRNDSCIQMGGGMHNKMMDRMEGEKGSMGKMPKGDMMEKKAGPIDKGWK
ncbi:MAG: hypothetical protein PHE88_03670 [Elusimicrobia bacterium]|nr:hypothetical protein [Elusimicrobiota bacterium]